MSEQRVEAVALPKIMDALRAVSGLTERLVGGIYVADVGCGSGEATVTMASAFPRSRFLGIEPDPARLDRARRLAAAHRVRNVYWLAVGAHQLAPRPSYDLICAFDGIYDMLDPHAALRAIRAALAADGVYLWCESAALDDHRGVRELAEEAGFAHVERLSLEDSVSRFFALRR